MTAIDEGRALKAEGVARSGERLTEEDREVFLAVVEAIEPGTWFSINDVREQLDAAEIPAASRAHLFYAACKSGLIDPVMFSVGGQVVAHQVRSTGRSAHNARVNVYERMGGST